MSLPGPIVTSVLHTVEPDGDIIPVSALNPFPLPEGAATEATLEALNNKIPVSGLATETTLQTVNTTCAGTTTAVNTVNTSVNTVNTTVGTVKTSVDAVNVTIAGTTTAVNTVNTSIGTLNTTCGGTTTAVNTVNTSVGTVNTSVGVTNTNFGAQADAAATTDTGSFSLIAFIKRGLQNWTTLLARVPVVGQKTMSASMPVVLASDQTGLTLAGGAAQGAAPVGNPLLCGAEARTTNPTAVGDGTVVRLRADKTGRLVTTVGQPRELYTTTYFQTSSTSEQTLVAGIANVFQDIHSITLTNVGLLAASRVDIRAATGGSIIASLWVGTNNTVQYTFDPIPLKQPTAGANWTVVNSGGVDLRVTVTSVQNI